MKRFWNALMEWAEVLAQYRRQNGQYRGYY